MKRSSMSVLTIAALAGSAWGAELLKWAGYEKDPHPCLYITTRDVERFKQVRPDRAGLKPDLTWASGQGGLDQAIAAALTADNASAQKSVADGALKAMDALLARIPETINKNTGPHAYAREFGEAAGLADAALAGSALTPEAREQLLAKIAKVNYLINDPNYWTVEAGKSLCPNMFSTAAGYRLTMAALIPSHPQAKGWFGGALKELKEELDGWVDAGGGMIECPHYSMVVFDQWIGAFLIARNAGAPDAGFLFDAKLRKAIEWFGNISTPRDPRNNGLRRLPSLGHTYVNERTGMFGVMACLWKDKDPQFAAQMEWMHREHGSFGEPGILSYYPALMGYRLFFKDSGVAPKAPAWSSAVYSETGVLLRNTIGSDRETTLYMIAGRNHSHYFNDSGSITIWGKGRELLDEDSYQFRRSPDSRSVHSMPDKPATFNEERVMALHEFSASPQLDYARGNRRGWQRQIAFVKDADPLGPNYFVVADTFDAKSVPTISRFFVLAEKVAANGPAVMVTGKDDVDMDIVFVSPAKAAPEAHTNHVSLAVGKDGTVMAVLFPRLKTEKPPQVTALADGKGVKVVTSAGTDYLFLNPEPFSFSVGDVVFEGRVGLVRVRDGKAVRTVVEACDVKTDREGGDRELRAIPWNGPSYPVSPDE